MKLPWNREHSDLDREVAYHIETLADSFEAQGMTRQEALLRARREFGGVEQVKEQCRDESRWSWLVQFSQDLRFGWRMMRRSPSISMAAVLSLALGIGATTAMFSLADTVLWRSLPVPAPEQMVELQWESLGSTDGLLRSSSGSSFREDGKVLADFFSSDAFDAIRTRAAGKVAVASHMYPREVSASYGGNVHIAELRGVSSNFFDVLQLNPYAGRLLSRSPSELEIVVSYDFWERRLGRDAKAIGSTLRVNNNAYQIAGVLPRSFYGIIPGDRVQLYTTIEQSPELLREDSWYRESSGNPLTWWLQLIGRRAAEVTPEQAQALLHTAFAASWPAQPKSLDQAPRLRLQDASTGLGSLRRQMGDPMWALLALVTMVLLVACANIANLLLARAAAREKEVALRVSLGCSYGQLMRQFLTESLLLAIVGGALSIGVVLGIRALLESLMPQMASMGADIDSRSLGITAAVTLTTVLLFGLYPAWRTARLEAAPALKEGTGTAGTMSRRRWLPAKVLVLAQVAFGVVLVMSAILFTGHLSEIVNRDAGFDRAHTLLFDLRPGELGYDKERLALFHTEVENALRAIPGVKEVGLSRIRPMRGGGFHESFRTPGMKRGINSGVHFGNAGFLSALGVPLVAGRFFTAEEVRNQRPVVVISERLAKELKLPAALGARVEMNKNEYEVIGVTRDALYSRLTNPMPVSYLPLEKNTGTFTVLMRTQVPPMAVLSAAREAIRGINRDLPLVDVFTMEQQISRTLQRERMFAWLCGSFGVLALVLCVVGLYGLMSHTTARRTPEIGIRLALGASSRTVMRQVVSEGMRLALIGMCIGIPLAIWAAQFAQKQGMIDEGRIPYWSLAGAAGVLIVSALLAVFGPALRAATIDPMRALRQG